MAEIHVTKPSAAQRQLDAAIRMLFSGEDVLAIYTVTAAARGILGDIASQRPENPERDVIEFALKQAQKQFPNEFKSSSVPDFERLHRSHRRRPANFLKHADRDWRKTLKLRAVDTDGLLVEACGLYLALGLKPTPEVYAFCRWHLAVYPREKTDPLKTAAGYVHELNRDAQLQAGALLLKHYKDLSRAPEIPTAH